MRKQTPGWKQERPGAHGEARSKDHRMAQRLRKKGTRDEKNKNWKRTGTNDGWPRHCELENPARERRGDVEEVPKSQLLTLGLPSRTAC